MYTSIQRGGCQIIYQPNNYKNILYNIKRISSTNQYRNTILGLELFSPHRAEIQTQAVTLTMWEELNRNLMSLYLEFIGLVESEPHS